jgi:hypothetical protein
MEFPRERTGVFLWYTRHSDAARHCYRTYYAVRLAADLPTLSGSTDLTVPLCCRKNGKHHCVMSGAEANNSGTVITTIAGKCPCCPQATAASHVRFCTPGISEAVFAGLVRHPAVSLQTEASYPISYDHSRQKRGPLSLILC